MSGVLIAEGRAVCYDPQDNNCAARTFVLTPERDAEFITLMGPKIDDYNKAVNGEEMDSLIDGMCKDIDPSYIGKRVTCCPPIYDGDYLTGLFDQNLVSRDKMVGPDAKMNLGKIENGINMLCDKETLAKCDMTQVELEKEGYENPADCIRKQCLDAGYRIAFDKKKMCLVDDETDSNPATDCPTSCAAKKIVERKANMMAFYIAIGCLVLLLLVALGSGIYFWNQSRSSQPETKFRTEGMRSM